MPPRVKKRRINPAAAEEEGLRTPPVVFKSPGLQPDVRLKVFDTDFHVHSVVLKLHSNYFRRFLDAPDKPEGPASPLFRYEYSTVVDEDGTWALEPLARYAAPFTEDMRERLTGSSAAEVMTFRCLLSAMYNRPFEIDEFPTLKALTRLADFYCALPVLSASLASSLLTSPIFREDNDPFSFAGWSRIGLTLAKKLRNPALFRESFVHVVGDYTSNDYDYFDEDISRLINREHSNLCQQIMKTQQLLFGPLRRFPTLLSPDMMRQLHSTARPKESAPFFKNLKVQVDALLDSGYRGAPDLEDLNDSLADLLANNLVLDQRRSVVEDYFLCANLADFEMPWDQDEVDW